MNLEIAMKVLEARSVDRLTMQEREIVILIARGYPESQIVQRLAISTGSLRKHVLAIHDKLGVESRLDLVLYGLAHPL